MLINRLAFVVAVLIGLAACVQDGSRNDRAMLNRSAMSCDVSHDDSDRAEYEKGHRPADHREEARKRSGCLKMEKGKNTARADDTIHADHNR